MASGQGFYRSVCLHSFVGLRFNFVYRLFTRNLDYEIIVIDDASPDGTLEIAKQLQQVYGENRIVSISLQFLPSSFAITEQMHCRFSDHAQESSD